MVARRGRRLSALAIMLRLARDGMARADHPHRPISVCARLGLRVTLRVGNRMVVCTRAHVWGGVADINETERGMRVRGVGSRSRVCARAHLSLTYVCVCV